MIRTLRKNNETLQLGTLRDRRTMASSSASFRDYDAAVSCLRRFVDDSYNMMVLRRFLGENSCQVTGHSLTDQEVISQVARKVAQGEFFFARKRAVQYGGGGATPSVKEVVEHEPKKWNKTDYIKQFLREHEVEPVVPKITPEPVLEQETNWVAFKVLYDDTDEPLSGVDLKVRLPDGSTDIYTTDGAGKIYIAGLPDGTCDIEAMLDNDALEVVGVWSKKRDNYIESFLNRTHKKNKSTSPETKETQETNWVEFKVLYDDTDEPVADVELKLRLPDGSTDIYQTDASGKIYISGLSDGMCDIEEMLDNDALEVVEILAG